MYFQLRKLILWPRSSAAPRIVEFSTGVVNVISGASKTGKSAVIPIIDYCLGSEKCSIPVGVIRENCSWFGVLVDTLEGQKLLARKEPGNHVSTGDMYVIEGAEIAVPNQIEAKNSNLDIVKAMLNRLSGLTNLEFEPNTENGFKARPSFRDLMAFTFQPQNVVANPDVMFFKADTTEHREKLKTIFPYVLGAVTSAMLQARFELDRLGRLLRRKEAEQRALSLTGNAWRIEAQGWLRQAIEFGLLSAAYKIPSDWFAIVDELRLVVATNADTALPTIAGIDVALGRLRELRHDESRVASELNGHRQRLNELRRLLESSQAYGGAIHVQRDRLALASWFRTLLSDSADDEPLSVLGSAGRDRILALTDKLEGIEVQLRTHPGVAETLDKEMLRLRGATETVLSELNEIRSEIALLERNSQQAKEVTDRFDRSERFLGRLEQALKLYDNADQSSEVAQEIEQLKMEIARIQATVSESDAARKLQNALARIEAYASRLIPQLDAEWPDAPIRIIINDLTLKVVRGNRDDYLWEIGSGANWLAYHVALTVALQRFFMAEPHHPVPGLLIYDQPSQVYFPRRAAGEEATDVVSWRDQDVIAVRKIFSLLADETSRAKGRLQVIVLDHADSEVWGGIENVVLTAEWRGEALVPAEWIRTVSVSNLEDDASR